MNSRIRALECRSASPASAHRFSLPLVLSAALVAIVACAANAKVEVKKVDYRGWKDCYELSNSLVRLVIVPAIGGRIMEYSIGGDNVMWQNGAELGVVQPSDVGKKWHNYGGYKAWNSPQYKWRFPDNDNFYDYAPAKTEIVKASIDGEEMGGVRITASPIPHLGFQFIREVYLSPVTSRVRLVETMHNVSDHEIEWGAWDVTQVSAPCWVAFPIKDNSKFPLGWALLGPDGKNMNQVTRFGDIGVLKYTGVIDKVGTDSRDGWLAYFANDLAYVKRWHIDRPDSDYPDGGCTTEVFTADKAMGGYVELEVMGPIAKLVPGGKTELVEDWFLTRTSKAPTHPSDVIGQIRLLRDQGSLPGSVAR